MNDYQHEEEQETPKERETSPFGVSSVQGTLVPPRRRTKGSRVRSVEVSGQCSVCLDFFTVTLYALSGREWRVSETPRLTWRYRVGGERVLTHRPDLCDGRVTLWGAKDCLDDPRPATRSY